MVPKASDLHAYISVTEYTQTWEGKPSEDRSRDQNDAATSHGTVSTAPTIPEAVKEA